MEVKPRLDPVSECLGITDRIESVKKEQQRIFNFLRRELAWKIPYLTAGRNFVEKIQAAPDREAQGLPV